MRVDLHIHTIASDGSWTPDEVVREAGRCGVGCIAVTDHDTTECVAETARLAEAAGIRLITGVEISTTLNGRSFHILGYGIDPADRPLQDLLQHNRVLMTEVDHDSIRKLIASGLAIDYDEYEAYCHDPARGGWKSLNFLIDQGLCRDAADYFANLFTEKRGIRFPDFPPPFAAIAAIRQAGGIAVLAHPGSSFHGSELTETLDFFGREDIDGVECYHCSHGRNTIHTALEWCRRQDKLITGGSDSHGSFIPARCLGFPSITLQELALGDIII